MLHETHVCRDCGAEVTMPYVRPDAARTPSQPDLDGVIAVLDDHEFLRSASERAAVIEELRAALAISGAVSPAITIGNDPDGTRADVRQSGIEPLGTGLGDMVGSPRSESSGASHPTSVRAGHGPLAADSDGHAALGASSRFHEISVTDESSAPSQPDLREALRTAIADEVYIRGQGGMKDALAAADRIIDRALAQPAPAAVHSCGCLHDGPCRESNCGHHEWQDHPNAEWPAPAAVREPEEPAPASEPDAP